MKRVKDIQTAVMGVLGFASAKIGRIFWFRLDALGLYNGHALLMLAAPLISVNPLLLG
jgi:hypothetical protein